eukprot:3744461-Rhodomonas_salina.3
MGGAVFRLDVPCSSTSCRRGPPVLPRLERLISIQVEVTGRICPLATRVGRGAIQAQKPPA